MDWSEKEQKPQQKLSRVLGNENSAGQKRSFRRQMSEVLLPIRSFKVEVTTVEPEGNHFISSNVF